MPGKTTLMSREDDEAARRQSTISNLGLILGLLQTARDYAGAVAVADDEATKSELLDAIAVAELSAIRMLEDEGG